MTAPGLRCIAAALLLAALLAACGGGGPYPPGQTDEDGRATIGTPACAASGACT